jgi:hypothetical protein
VSLWERITGMQRTHIETQIPRAATLRDAEDAALLAAYHGVFPTLPTLHAHYGPSLNQHGWLIGDPLPSRPSARDRRKPQIRMDSVGESTRIQLSQQHRIDSKLFGSPLRLLTTIFAVAVTGYTAVFLLVAGLTMYLNLNLGYLGMTLFLVPAVFLVVVGAMLMAFAEFTPGERTLANTAAEVDAATGRLHALAKAIDNRLSTNNTARLSARQDNAG